MDYLSYTEIAKKLVPIERIKYLITGTAVRPNDILQKVASLLEVKNIAEIGTGNGISAVALASCSNVRNVITFDIRESHYRNELSEVFDTTKIKFFVTKDSKEIYKFISKYDFDLAYIDGNHNLKPMNYPLQDFNAVKYIGKVLFDDAHNEPITQILKDNKGRMIGNRFGYWCKDGNYDIVDKINSTLIWDEEIAHTTLKYDYSHIIKSLENDIDKKYAEEKLEKLRSFKIKVGG